MDQMNSQANLGLSDQILAADLLNATKAAIKSYAWAISETASENVKQTLNSQLNEAIQAHSNVTKYMVSKGYYQPYDMKQQISLDNQNAQQVQQARQNQRFQ